MNLTISESLVEDNSISDTIETTHGFRYLISVVYTQYSDLRGRERDEPGTIVMEVGAGEDEVGRWFHQLVAPDENQTPDYRPVSRRERKQRIVSGR